MVLGREHLVAVQGLNVLCDEPGSSGSTQILLGCLLAVVQVPSVGEATMVPWENRQPQLCQNVKGLFRPFTQGLAKSEVSTGVSRLCESAQLAGHKKV